MNKIGDWAQVVARMESGMTLEEAQRNMKPLGGAPSNKKPRMVSDGQRKAIIWHRNSSEQ